MPRLTKRIRSLAENCLVYGLPTAARTAETTAIGPKLFLMRRCRRCASPGNSDMTPLTMSVLTPRAASLSATATPSPSGSSQSATTSSYSSEPRQTFAALTPATVSTVYPSPRNTSARISRVVGSSSTSRMRFIAAIRLSWAGLIRPADPTFRVHRRLDAVQPQMANKVRVNSRHDAVVVRSAASIAHHHLPSSNPDTLVDVRAVLKLPLA